MHLPCVPHDESGEKDDGDQGEDERDEQKKQWLMESSALSVPVLVVLYQRRFGELTGTRSLQSIEREPVS